MSVTKVFTGDTKTVRANFTNKVTEDAASGPLIDSDDQTVSVTIYNSEEASIEVGAATRVSQGVYEYDWTAPSEPGSYWVEFKGLFNTEPQLARRKFSVKFKGDQ